MRHAFRSAVRTALIPAALVLASQAVGAQEYPAHEIRSICNFAAGSGADILVRHSPDLESQVRTLVGADNLVVGSLATD